LVARKEARSRDIEIKKRKREENQSLLDEMAYAKCMPCKRDGGKETWGKGR
jgi:hypothetical protein